jgi:hypothetical protein
MTADINLRTSDRCARHTFLEDGLCHVVMLGLSFLFMSLFLMDRRFVFLFVWPGLAPGIIELIKKRVTYPRTGYVVFPRPAILMLLILLACAAGIVLSLTATALARALLGVPLGGDWRETLTLALMLFVGGMLCFLGYRAKTYRWVVYGVLAALALIFGRAVDEPLVVTGLGLVFVLTGLALFVRFMIDNPVLEEGALHEH